jgi:hypothetical protein
MVRTNASALGDCSLLPQTIEPVPDTGIRWTEYSVVCSEQDLQATSTIRSRRSSTPLNRASIPTFVFLSSTRDSGSSSYSWLIHVVARRIQLSQVVFAAAAKVHRTFRLLHSQQFRVPLRTFLRLAMGWYLGGLVVRRYDAIFVLLMP